MICHSLTLPLVSHGCCCCCPLQSGSLVKPGCAQTYACRTQTLSSHWRISIKGVSNLGRRGRAREKRERETEGCVAFKKGSRVHSRVGTSIYTIRTASVHYYTSRYSSRSHRSTEQQETYTRTYSLLYK